MPAKGKLANREEKLGRSDISFVVVIAVSGNFLPECVVNMTQKKIMTYLPGEAWPPHGS